MMENTATKWIGWHKTMGKVVFYPDAQRGLEREKIKLYVVDEKRMATFGSEAVSDKVVDFQTYSNARDQIRGAEVKANHFPLRSIRSTHCFSCKTNLNSRDFDVCPDCGWIVCSCGACGCEFE